MPRQHIHGPDAGLAADTIRHHSWQSLLVRSFPYCISNLTYIVHSYRTTEIGISEVIREIYSVVEQAR